MVDADVLIDLKEARRQLSEGRSKLFERIKRHELRPVSNGRKLRFSQREVSQLIADMLAARTVAK